MRLIHDPPHRLVVKANARGLRLCGAIVAIAGSMFAIALEADSIVPRLIGVLVLMSGAMMVVFPAYSTIVFDRASRRMIVSRRRMWERKARRWEEYQLDDVAAAQPDESRDSDGGSTWRVVVRLSSGAIVPLTSYYSSGRRTKDDTADQINQFLGKDSGTQSVGGLASPHAIAPTNRKAAVVVGILFVLFGSVFGGVGGTLFTREFIRLRSWLPIQATVLSTRVDTRYDSDGNTYSPVVTYRYTVRGREYTSSGTLPVRESRSGRWARRITERFTPGNSYTAWFDPENPSNAFIVRSRSIVGPVFAIMGLFAVVAGVGVAASARKA